MEMSKKENTKVLFGMKEKNEVCCEIHIQKYLHDILHLQNMSGEHKTAIHKWIGLALFPNHFMIDGTKVAKCIKGKIEECILLIYLLLLNYYALIVYKSSM